MKIGYEHHLPLLFWYVFPKVGLSLRQEISPLFLLLLFVREVHKLWCEGRKSATSASCHRFPLDLLFKQISYNHFLVFAPGMFPHLQWKWWGVLKPGWSFDCITNHLKSGFCRGFRFFLQLLLSHSSGIWAIKYTRFPLP